MLQIKRMRVGQIGTNCYLLEDTDAKICAVVDPGDQPDDIDQEIRKAGLTLTMILITHDLGVVAETCDKVAIMYAGEVIEYGTLEQIFDHVAHPYTIGLFGSLPSLDKDVRRLSPIPGLMPDPANLPEGCKFHPRCPDATDSCRHCCPAAVEIEPGHFIKCLKYAAKEDAPDE